MVTTTLIGQMGNQMFQIAAAIGYAKKYKMDFCIPEKSLDPNVWKNYFNFPVTNFNPRIVYNEQKHNYKEIPFYKDVRLNGYFQSKRYFEHCMDEVRHYFKIQDEPYNKVSIHVRRGDYLLHPNLFPVLPEVYYKTAIERFKEKGLTDFIVFSDDIAWCKENITAEKYGVNVEYANGNEYEDFYLMSRCTNSIIANSSYSLIAAILNKNVNTVMAPFYLRWFGKGNRHLNTMDVIPKEWIQIQF